MPSRDDKDGYSTPSCALAQLSLSPQLNRDVISGANGMHQLHDAIMTGEGQTLPICSRCNAPRLQPAWTTPRRHLLRHFGMAHERMKDFPTPAARLSIARPLGLACADKWRDLCGRNLALSLTSDEDLHRLFNFQNFVGLCLQAFKKELPQSFYSPAIFLSSCQESAIHGAEQRGRESEDVASAILS